MYVPNAQDLRSFSFLPSITDVSVEVMTVSVFIFSLHVLVLLKFFLIQHTIKNVCYGKSTDPLHPRENFFKRWQLIN